MMHDITKLHSVSIWMTLDMVTYEFLVEFREIKRLMANGKYKTLKELVDNITNYADTLIQEGAWTSYIVECIYGKRFICLSDQSNLSKGDIIISNGDSKVLDQQIDLCMTLTDREKQIFCLLGEGLVQNDICKKLDIGLATMKSHRNHIYSKMGFESKTSLLLWCAKYRDTVFKKIV